MAGIQKQTYETHARSVTKALVWRILASIATVLLFFAFTGKWKIALEAGAIEVILKLAMYYSHERAWNLITWGRLRQQNINCNNNNNSDNNELTENHANG